MNPALLYIEQIPEPYRSILIHVQWLIEKHFPSAVLLYKYKIPFYYLDGKTMFCYLNFRKSFVDLGLVDGASLKDVHGVLIGGEDRKMVRSFRFYTMEDIQEEIILEYLIELQKLLENKKF